MKAEELRKGNILLCNGFEVEIDGIQKNMLAKVDENFYTPIDQFEPIPLTEEWLLKSGFIFKKQSGICGQDQWSGMDFYMKDNITLRGNLKKSNMLALAEYFNCQIEYVRQLQNLFYALTGTELIINENSF